MIGMWTFMVLLTILTVYGGISTPADMRRRSVDSVATYNSIPNEVRNVKKDVFMSRGWGAGGMPFSVLYMNPYASKAPIQAEEPYKMSSVYGQPKEHRPKTDAQLRTAMGAGRRKQYSIIPQLFVSYGWGPLGKELARKK